MSLAIVASLAILGSASATDQGKRFLEFSSDNDTITFDLNTVQIVDPGRFTVVGTTIDNLDVLKFKLRVVGTLKGFCTRPVGKYATPQDLLALGPADMPIQNIEVQGDSTRKTVLWYFPYERLALGTASKPSEGFKLIFCNDIIGEYRDVTNGFRMKELFDCKRALHGLFLNPDDDPSKAVTSVVNFNTEVGRYYVGVCNAVLNRDVYIPDPAGTQ